MIALVAIIYVIKDRMLLVVMGMHVQVIIIAVMVINVVIIQNLINYVFMEIQLYN